MSVEEYKLLDDIELRNKGWKSVYVSDLWVAVHSSGQHVVVDTWQDLLIAVEQIEVDLSPENETIMEDST